MPSYFSVSQQPTWSPGFSKSWWCCTGLSCLLCCGFFCLSCQVINVASIICFSSPLCELHCTLSGLLPLLQWLNCHPGLPSCLFFILIRCKVVPDQYFQIFLSLLVQHTLGPVVKVLPLHLCISCVSAALHYLHVLHLCPELGGDASGADCLPANECSLCFLRQNQGNSSLGGNLFLMAPSTELSPPDDSLGCPVSIWSHTDQAGIPCSRSSLLPMCCLPCFTIQVVLDVRRGGWLCSFHQAFTATHHTPSGWIPSHAQVWFCHWYFSNRLGFSQSRTVSPTPTP